MLSSRLAADVPRGKNAPIQGLLARQGGKTGNYCQSLERQEARKSLNASMDSFGAASLIPIAAVVNHANEWTKPCWRKIGNNSTRRSKPPNRQGNVCQRNRERKKKLKKHRLRAMGHVIPPTNILTTPSLANFASRISARQTSFPFSCPAFLCRCFIDRPASAPSA
jgi:hypothetical protein